MSAERARTDLGSLLACVTDEWEFAIDIASRAGINPRTAGPRLRALRAEGLVVSAFDSVARKDRYRRGLKAPLVVDEHDRDLRDIRRCVHSLAGALDCVRESIRPAVSGLGGIMDGGLPEILALVRRALPGDDAQDHKSLCRGYQTLALLRREEETGQRDPQAWAEDPEVFCKREWAR
jgi:hypothetical protein